MRTWDDYKKHVRAVDPESAKDLDEVENAAAIVSAMVAQRNALGLSQRDLAALCGIPQSSVARIESLRTLPNLGTLLRIFQRLGLKLTVTLERPGFPLPRAAKKAHDPKPRPIKKGPIHPHTSAGQGFFARVLCALKTARTSQGGRQAGWPRCRFRCSASAGYCHWRCSCIHSRSVHCSWQ